MSSASRKLRRGPLSSARRVRTVDTLQFASLPRAGQTRTEPGSTEPRRARAGRSRSHWRGRCVSCARPRERRNGADRARATGFACTARRTPEWCRSGTTGSACPGRRGTTAASTKRSRRSHAQPAKPRSGVSSQTPAPGQPRAEAALQPVALHRRTRQRAWDGGARALQAASGAAGLRMLTHRSTLRDAGRHAHTGEGGGSGHHS